MAKRKTAQSISHSPQDAAAQRLHPAPKSRGEPRTSPSGASVAYASFPTVRSKGEPKTAPDGASPADAWRTYSSKPNLKNRKG